MPESKSKSDNPQAVKGYSPPDDPALEEGFRGQKVDPRDNSEYSLESGPDSPSALDQNVDALKQRVSDAESSSAKGNS